MASDNNEATTEPGKMRWIPESRLARSFLWLENHFEAFLFASRWLAAPIYFGLVLGLGLLLFKFFVELKVAFQQAVAGTLDAVPTVLTFIDIALVTNLLLIVILAGYEHFVSKIDTANDEDRPGWMNTVGFAGLKLKLFASIIAITGIELLKAFMDLRDERPVSAQTLTWLILIHITFLFTAVLSSIADWLSSRVEPPEQDSPSKAAPGGAKVKAPHMAPDPAEPAL